jgi:porphobilinogen synthase
MPAFPEYRGRRLRRTESLRHLIRETSLAPGDLILPLFVRPGRGVRQAVNSMPGVFQTSVDEALRDAEEAAQLGLGALLLFGLPETKDETGSQAYADEGIVQRAVRELKRAFPDLVLITDVCLCEYTSHGHCGIVQNGVVQNDETLALLARQAVSHALAGADLVGPSDMMDGRVSYCTR